jgi:hypothetical protein
MLSSRGATSKVRSPIDYNLHRVSKLFGVSDAAVRLWYRKGLFGEPADEKKKRGKSQSGPRLPLETVVAFCVKHPDKVNAEEGDPDLLLLIEDKNVRLPGWHGTRQHLVQSRHCPQCRRVIRGNAYFRHFNTCNANSSPASEIEVETVTK